MVDSSAAVLHSAKFSKAIIERLDQIVPLDVTVLDPFAGVGCIHQLGVPFSNRDTYGIEIEPEWAAAHPRTEVGNALELPFDDGTFDVCVTSPCYGNRFADHHAAKDGSIRRSYTHDMRRLTGDADRKLHPDNAGTLAWGPKYRAFHIRAWREVWRVLVDGGYFYLNVSDFYANRRRVKVTNWHVGAVIGIGFMLEDRETVMTPRMRHGANRERVEGEQLLTFRKVGG